MTVQIFCLNVNVSCICALINLFIKVNSSKQTSLLHTNSPSQKIGHSLSLKRMGRCVQTFDWYCIHLSSGLLRVTSVLMIIIIFIIDFIFVAPFFQNAAQSVFYMKEIKSKTETLRTLNWKGVYIKKRQQGKTVLCIKKRRQG